MLAATQRHDTSAATRPRAERRVCACVIRGIHVADLAGLTLVFFCFMGGQIVRVVFTWRHTTSQVGCTAGHPTPKYMQVLRMVQAVSLKLTAAKHQTRAAFFPRIDKKRILLMPQLSPPPPLPSAPAPPANEEEQARHPACADCD